MAKHSKRYRAIAPLVDRNKTYTPQEGVQLLKQIATAKFDETAEVHFRLGVDPRHADQMVRGVAPLPAGTGKVQKVLVFAQGDKAREAEEAGADFVGVDDIIKKIEGGWIEFDVAVATPDVMGKVGRLGKILGRRSLMPNPKAGTITQDITKAIKDIRAGRVEFRVDKTSLVHVPFGKVSFAEDQLMTNLTSVVESVVKARPSGAKGQYVKSVVLTTSMGPSLRLDVPTATALRLA